MTSNILKKVTHTRGFTIIDNKLLQTNLLSMKAKGLAVYLLSLPDNWVVHQTELRKHFTDGQSSIAAAIKELRVAGYVKIEQLRSVGRITGWRTYVRESLDIPWPLPELDFRDLENKDLQNSTLLSTNNTKDPFIESTHIALLEKDDEKKAGKELKAKPNKITKEDIQVIFNEMWKVYPIKKSKVASLAALEKKLKGKGMDDARTLAIAIWEGLKAHIMEHGAKTKLKAQGADIWVAQLPHLSTWISQERWSDEYQKPEDVLLHAEKKRGIIDLESFFAGQ